MTLVVAAGCLIERASLRLAGQSSRFFSPVKTSLKQDAGATSGFEAAALSSAPRWIVAAQWLAILQRLLSKLMWPGRSSRIAPGRCGLRCPRGVESRV